MMYVSLISFVLSDWAGALVSDSKLIGSIIIGALGTAATVMRNLSALTENRTVRDHVKQETARLKELVEVLANMPDCEDFSECKKELHLQLAQSLSKLDALRAKEHRLAQDPHYNLTFWQRVFIWFPPANQRAWGVHALAHAFMLAGPLAVLLWSLFEGVHSAMFSDAVIFVVFGGLAFRAWALAERKWALPATPKAEPGLPTLLLVLRQAVNRKMLIAQISMWFCIFCAVESLEDIFLAAIEGTSARGGFLLFGISLLGAGVCRSWAAAEWRHPEVETALGFPRMVFPILKGQTAKIWGLAMVYVAIVAAPILALVHWTAFNKIFVDPIDQIEVAFVWLASSVACNRLLSLHTHIASGQTGEETSRLSPSPAVAEF